jgi:hypothetical protein
MGKKQSKAPDEEAIEQAVQDVAEQLSESTEDLSRADYRAVLLAVREEIDMRLAEVDAEIKEECDG